MTITPYAPTNATSCLLVEVYLPKHVRNQGALIDLLLDIIELEKAKEDLLGRVGRGMNIHSPVTSRPVGWGRRAEGADIDEPITLREIIENLKEGLLGYSVYEVDGAFRPSKSDLATTAPDCATDGAQSENPANTKSVGGRRVPIRRSAPFTVPPHCAAALDADAARESWDSLVEYLNGNVPRCTERPRPSTGRIVEVELRSGLYTLERADDAPDSVVATKCLRLFEERTLVVRFLIDLEEMQDRAITVADGSSTTNIRRVVEAFILIGEYLVQQLGETVATEDQIWIYYDVGHVWKWYKGRTDLTRLVK